MDSNSHAHRMIDGGNKHSTDRCRSHCVVRRRNALVRGFGPAVFTLLGTSPNPAVHKAAGVGQPVTQEIAWRVKGGRAECSINGTVVAGYDKAQLVVPGKLQSIDGVYGVRFSHNVEAVITGLAMTKG